MLMQSFVVALIVIGCALYAMWALMPAALRRRTAAAMLAWPLPEAALARLRRHANDAGGCGCDGCDQGSKPGVAAKAPPAPVQPIRFHPRPPR